MAQETAFRRKWATITKSQGTMACSLRYHSNRDHHRDSLVKSQVAQFLLLLYSSTHGPAGAMDDFMGPSTPGLAEIRPQNVLGWSAEPLARTRG
jgi:hypothetical protein